MHLFVSRACRPIVLRPNILSRLSPRLPRGHHDLWTLVSRPMCNGDVCVKVTTPTLDRRHQWTPQTCCSGPKMTFKTYCSRERWHFKCVAPGNHPRSLSHSVAKRTWLMLMCLVSFPAYPLHQWWGSELHKGHIVNDSSLQMIDKIPGC